jgi:transcription termination/antitermination protein NusA
MSQTTEVMYADEILDAIKYSLKIVFMDSHGLDKEEEEFVTVNMDAEKGDLSVRIKREVVATPTKHMLEIFVDDAKKINKNLEIGDFVETDVTGDVDFGRIAAQTARQVILQKLRDSEKEAVLRQFSDKIGKIINVTVQRVLPEGDIICEVGKAKAIMPKSERVMTEYYRLGSQIKVLLKSIEEDLKGKFMLISRADESFLKELFAMEIPEIESGTVEIMGIAREAGSRSKVAVRSVSQGVDPIGSCVGQKGVRINAISNELKNGNFEEKIDIILWDDSIEQFIMNAIRPANSIKVEVTDKRSQSALVVVPDSELSLAIGKDGQNARLATKLTGWTLNIEGENGEVEQNKSEEVEEDSESEE